MADRRPQRPLRIINDRPPLHCTGSTSPDENGRSRCFDLSGGTFDVSLRKSATNLREVKSTSGDNKLGDGGIEAR